MLDQMIEMKRPRNVLDRKDDCAATKSRSVIEMPLSVPLSACHNDGNDFALFIAEADRSCLLDCLA
jgi:hypothetical protein